MSRLHLVTPPVNNRPNTGGSYHRWCRISQSAGIDRPDDGSFCRADHHDTRQRPYLVLFSLFAGSLQAALTSPSAYRLTHPAPRTRWATGYTLRRGRTVKFFNMSNIEQNENDHSNGNPRAQAEKMRCRQLVIELCAAPCSDHRGRQARRPLTGGFAYYGDSLRNRSSCAVLAGLEASDRACAGRADGRGRAPGARIQSSHPTGRPVVSERPSAAKAPVQIAEGAPQPILALRRRDDMDVVGHQAIGPDLDRRLGRRFAEQVAIEAVIRIAEERRLPPIAALGDMVRNVGNDQAGDASHGAASRR